MIDISTLNSVQRQAVLDTEGGVLVFAGAGSGKTRVLTMRIANILEKGLCYPDRILAITFTNKAANEMKQRLSAFDLNVQDMWVCTIHSMCTRILRRDIDKIGYDSNFSIYSDTEKQRMLKGIIADFDFEEELLKKAMWCIGDAKSNGLSPKEYENSHLHYKDVHEICSIYQEYEKQMMKNNALDFDDLLIKTHLLLSTCEEVRDKYSEKFKYIHIDEFQDVNDIQYKIVKLLYKNHKNIFAVGDDDQSIYGFRGANVKNILNFTSDFEGVKVYKLEQNYRSTKKILSLANAIISKNTGRADKKLWCDKEDGVRIEYKSLYNETEEGSFVASAIKSLITYSGYSYSDIAVLYRMNSLSRSIEQEFLKYNIPCKVYGGQKFYERKEIKDLTAYLRAICNVKDNEALKRIINVPKRGIGDTTVEKLNKICIEENLYLYELLQGIEKRTEFNAGTKQKLVNFRNMLFLLMAKKQVDSPENFVKDVINYSEFMVQFADNSEENVSRRLNIEEFVSSVKEFSEDNPDSNIADFLQSITLSSAIDQTFENESAVSLATVHAVKGLEFKVVFIIGLDEKIFPILRNDTTPEDLEEERRLMYVAITRAMERLYLTRCETRYNYSVGERMTGIRSRFIEDVKDLLGLVDVKDNYDIEPAKEIFKGKIAIPQKPAPKKVPLNAYSIGDKVEHKKFGQGVVVNVKGGGEDCVLDIAFKGFGVKTLVVKYAPIQKI